MRRGICTSLFLFLYFSGLDLVAQDVQWRGPNRDGNYPYSMLLQEWPEGGPEVLFVTKGIGRGFSSAVATDKRIYVTGIMEGEEHLTALDKMSGELIWKSASMGANRSNMSPLLIDHCGKAYVIASTQTHMIGVDPENGEILGDYHYNFLNEKNENTTIFTSKPIYKDSCLWISNGWEVPSVMLEIAPDGRSVSEKFKDRTFDNQNMGVVLVDGFLYGSNFTGRNTGKSNLGKEKLCYGAP